jgi:hypothetical protein
MRLRQEAQAYPIFVYPVPLSMTSGAWRDILPVVYLLLLGML